VTKQETDIRLLKESIAHWERMRDQEEPDVEERPSSKHCSLCEEYFDQEVSGTAMCSMCPISAHVSSKLCRHTPFTAAGSSYTTWSALGITMRPQWRYKAQKEIDFLNEVLTGVENGTF